MVHRLIRRIHDIERRLSRSFGTDILTPKGRRAARWHMQLFDHAFLRVLWTNQYQIAPGVWRSNQPSPSRIRKLHSLGIRTILNLRGEDKSSIYLFEREACEDLGIELIDHKLRAHALMPRAQFMALFEIFDRIEKPFLLHCKSGADRAGLASALWLLDQEGASLDEAKAMLSLKFVHLKNTHTGLMDHVLEVFEADTRTGRMPIRKWFSTRYDSESITASFHAKMGWPEP